MNYNDIHAEISYYLSKINIYYKNFSLSLIIYLEQKYPNISTLQARWYMLKYNLENIPKCKYQNCNNDVKWNIRKKEFDLGCCKTHNQKITFILNYGVEHPLKNNIQKQKLKKSVQSKYGVDSIAKLENIQEKRRQTNLNKYGVLEVGASHDIREKIKQTNLDRYGVKEVLKSKEIRDKAQRTIKRKYGVDNVLSSKFIRQKINTTNLERYGSIFPMRNEEIQQKRLDTVLLKYDAYGANAHPDVLVKFKKTTCSKFYHDKILKNNIITPLFEFTEYKNIIDSDQSIKYKWLCKKCNIKFEEYSIMGHLPSCPHCFPRDLNILYSVSNLFDKIDIPNKVANTTSIIGREIDIFLPEFSIGIEVISLYWHSEQKGKDKYYHFNKTIEYENKGIRLIQIYDKEWHEKNEVILSHINRYIGKSKIIHSDSLFVYEIDKKIFNDFIKDNSFVSADYFSKLIFGIYYLDELIAVVNFSNISKTEIELRKYVIKNGFDISGNILKKVIDEKIHNKIIYYFQDRRYNSYIDIDKIIDNGFEFQGVTEPSDYYFNNYNMFISLSHINKNINKYLSDYNPSLTINENLEINGYLKIWDCGRLMFKSR